MGISENIVEIFNGITETSGISLDLGNHWEYLKKIVETSGNPRNQQEKFDGYLGLPTSVPSTLDWTSLDSNIFSSSLSSSSASSSFSSLVFLFCSFRVELRWWESWVMKSLLAKEKESSWVGSKGHQAVLQEKQVVSAGLEEEEEHTQLKERKRREERLMSFTHFSTVHFTFINPPAIIYPTVCLMFLTFILLFYCCRSIKDN